MAPTLRFLWEASKNFVRRVFGLERHVQKNANIMVCIFNGSADRVNNGPNFAIDESKWSKDWKLVVNFLNPNNIDAVVKKYL